MLSRYIKMDPIPWLIDGANPAVTYIVKNEILKQSDPEKNYNELLDSGLTGYFKKNYFNGILGDSKHLDLVYRGTIWFFLYAIESGYLSKTDFISSTADVICKTTQLSDGGFRFNYKFSEAIGCRTGNIVYALLKSGISDSRAASGINWIIKNQRKDGGWLHCPFTGFCDIMKLVLLNKSGSGLKYESDDEIRSCPIASYSCLKAIALSDNSLYEDEIRKGTDFFIKNDFFVNDTKKLLCGSKVSFNKIGYPVMSQYDYLSGMVLISGIDTEKIPVNSKLFNSIIKKQNNSGSWTCENNLQGMIREKSVNSRWTTLNALRLINAVVKKEDQLSNA